MVCRRSNVFPFLRLTYLITVVPEDRICGRALLLPYVLLLLLYSGVSRHTEVKNLEKEINKGLLLPFCTFSRLITAVDGVIPQYKEINLCCSTKSSFEIDQKTTNTRFTNQKSKQNGKNSQFY